MNTNENVVVSVCRPVSNAVWRTLWHSQDRPLFSLVELSLERVVDTFSWNAFGGVPLVVHGEPEHPALRNYLHHVGLAWAT
jgi:hypothetical protein